MSDDVLVIFVTELYGTALALVLIYILFDKPWWRILIAGFRNESGASFALTKYEHK